MKIEINWMVPHCVLLTPVDVDFIRSTLITYMNKYPNFDRNDLREIIMDFIANHYNDELYYAFGEEQCDEVLNKLLQGYGIQLSMFDKLGRIIDRV